MNLRRWLQGHRKSVRPIRRRHTLVPMLDELESRTLLTAVVWVGRQGGIETFQQTFGNNSDEAVATVDRAIADWNRIVASRGHGVPALKLDIEAKSLGGRLRGSAYPTDVSGLFSTHPTGIPLEAELKLDDDAGGAGWVMTDQFRSDDLAFTNIISPFAATSGPPGGMDLYTTVLHEIGHALGIALESDEWYADLGDFFGLYDQLKIRDFIVDTGIPDPNPNNSSATLYRLSASQPGIQSITATFTSSGGGHLFEGPATPATIAAGLEIHPNDLLNDGRTRGIGDRRLISDLDAAILSVVYGYDINIPRWTETIHTTWDPATSTVRVQGITTGSVTDDVTVRLTEDGKLQASVSGAIEKLDIPVSLIQRIQIDTFDGNDTISVLDLPGHVTLQLNSGPGSDVIYLGVPGDPKPLSERILGTVNIAASGTDTTSEENRLVLREVDETVIDGLGGRIWFGQSGQINFLPSEFISVELRGAAHGSEYFVDSWTADPLLKFEGHRDGFDRLQIALNGSRQANIEFQGNGIGSGRPQDEVVLVEHSDNYQGIYNVRDTTDSFSSEEFWMSDQLYPGSSHRYKFHFVPLKTIQGAGGSTGYAIHGTLIDAHWTINAGYGDDHLLVTPRFLIPFSSFGGQLRRMQGDVTFAGGPGENTVAINDQLATSAHDFMIEESFIQHSFYSTIHYSSVQSIDIRSGSEADTFQIHSTAAQSAYRLFGNQGDDTFTIGQGDLFRDARSTLRIEGGQGIDRIRLDDQSASIQGGYDFETVRASDGVQEGLFQKYHVAYIDLGPPLPPFPVVYETGEMTTRGIEEVWLQGSSQADEFSVTATPIGQDLILEGNAGDDDFRVNATGLRSSIRVLGGDPVATVLGDTLFVTGTSTDTGSYLPGTFTNNGRVVANGHNIDFRGLEPVYVEGFGSFGFTTPRSRDIIDIRRYPVKEFPGSPAWTEFSGTSGVVNTGFEVLRVRDIGTLSAVFHTNDLIREFPSNAYDPTDVVKIHPGALSGNRVGRLQLFMGFGNDRLIDHTLDGSRATTVLEPIFITPVEHLMTGVAARIAMGSLRAFGAGGELIHDVRTSGPGRMVLEDPQPLLTFERENAQIILDAAVGGRQRLQSSHSQISWEFQTTAQGEFSATLPGNSLVSIIAILIPRAPLLLGGAGADRMETVVALSGPQSEDRLRIEGFDEDDTLVVRTSRTPGTHSLFEIDLTDRRQTRISPWEIPDLPMPFGPSLDILVAQPLSGDGPQIRLVGSGSGADSVWARSPNLNPPAGFAPVRRVNLASIELLVFVGPDLSFGPVVGGGIRSESRTSTTDVLIESDALLRDVTLDTRTNPNFPSELGSVAIAYPEPDFRDLSINPFAIELLVRPVVDDISSTLTQQISRTLDQQNSRFRTEESIEVGGWDILRTLNDSDPVHTTAEGSRVDAILRGEFPESQDFEIRHVLTGSESTTFLDRARIRGDFSLDVIGKEGANNRVAISAVNSRFEGDVHYGFQGQSSGQNAIVIGETGVSFGDDSIRMVDIRTGGSDTVLFQANSNTTTAGGPMVTDVRVEGGPATVLTSAGGDLSPVELYGIIAILRQGSDNARINPTMNMLREAFERVGEQPTNGAEAARSVFLTGTGEITVAAYDATVAGTTIHVDVDGDLFLQRLAGQRQVWGVIACVLVGRI